MKNYRYNEFEEKNDELFIFNDFAECYEVKDLDINNKNCLRIYKSNPDAFTLQIRTYKPITGLFGKGKSRNMIAHLHLTISDLEKILDFMKRRLK